MHLERQNSSLRTNSARKKSRPIASGALSIKAAFGILVALLSLLCVFLKWSNSQLSLVILFYLALNIAYSFNLKKIVLFDVVILSVMYTLRIFAGAAAVDIEISNWLLNFSILLFFSLACIKRCTELYGSKEKSIIDGRGYKPSDFNVVLGLGMGTGLISILVTLLYFQSSEVKILYSQPQKLWLITPVLLFWISRVWLLTNRGEVHDDPVLFAIKDRTSWLCLAGIMLILFMAI